MKQELAESQILSYILLSKSIKLKIVYYEPSTTHSAPPCLFKNFPSSYLRYTSFPKKIMRTRFEVK